jgi:hypothetical protein
MRNGLIGCVLVGALATALMPGPAPAAAPLIERGSTHETFPDDLFADVCGIDTMTTLDEHWTLKTFPDGSETLHAERTFTPDDPRLPVEKGAATSFNAPDGSRRVVGKPIQLIWQGGAMALLDAGQVWFDANGDLVDMHGPHPSLAIDDLAALYCPAS